MRKFFAMGLCLILAISFVGCSSNKLTGVTIVGSFGTKITIPVSWQDKWQYRYQDSGLGDGGQTMIVYHPLISQRYGEDNAVLFAIAKYISDYIGPSWPESTTVSSTILGSHNGFTYIVNVPTYPANWIDDAELAAEFGDMQIDIPQIRDNITLDDFTPAGGLAGIGISVEMPKYEYSTDDERIEYKIVNRTGEPAQILLIPKLERNLGLQFEEKYEPVEYSAEVGFCGTADSIEDEREGTIELSWFKSMTEDSGKYRLYFGTLDGKKTDFAEFVVNAPKSLTE